MVDTPLRGDSSSVPGSPAEHSGFPSPLTPSPASSRRLLGFFRDDSFPSLPRLSKRLFGSRHFTPSDLDDPGFAAPAQGQRVQQSYPDRSHVDWNFEYRKERLRVEDLNAAPGLNGAVLRLWDLTVPWLVVAGTGLVIGVLAGCLDVLAEWLGDLRTGICRYAFYLDKASCCLDTELDACNEWKSWGEILGIRFAPVRAFLQYGIYIALAVTFAACAALLVKTYAAFAFHSGLPEIKTILSGYVINGYFSPWTLLIKAAGLALSVASGLSLGKEGPLVHVSCCVASILLQPFQTFRENEARKRELLSAAAAAGLSVAFGAPLGGVLFVLEELHISSLPQATLWRSFVCAVVATVSLRYFDPFKSGKIVLFQVQSVGQMWRAFEIIPWVLLGVMGGIFGAVFVRANIEYAKIRRSSGWEQFPIIETMGVAAFTALVCYLIPFMRIPTSELVEALFGDCGSEDPLGLCENSHSIVIVFLLLVVAAVRAILTAVTFGLPVPAGIFLPSIGIGACVGRAMGIVMHSWQQAYPRLWVFSACPPEGVCIAPQTYAVIGAASALGGMTRMTISLVVIIFELSGAIELVLQTMLAVMTSKLVADHFSTDGIYEAWINFWGYPYLSVKKVYRRDNVLARHVMTSDLLSLRSAGWTLQSLEEVLQEHDYKGYPIVLEDNLRMLMGYIPATELKFALAQARAWSGNNDSTECYFFDRAPGHGTSAEQGASQQPGGVNLNEWVDQAPLTFSPDMPMEIVVQSFQRIGLRYVLFTKMGTLVGALTKRDIHKHMRAPFYDSAGFRIRGAHIREGNSLRHRPVSGLCEDLAGNPARDVELPSWG